MTTISLEAIKFAHESVTEMIAKFEAQAARTIMLPQASITLSDGEVYAGIVLGANGAPLHHLVLLPGAASDITWPDALKWAKAQGGDLPNRSEQSLLFANAKAHFEQAYYWSSEQHAGNSDCAWFQYFSHGTQGSLRKSDEYRARAVRRLIIS